ncbi:MAG: hypothetical protein WKF59_11195 [Chitinophagaceae bacterium]
MQPLILILQRWKRSKLNDLTLQNIPFGKYFTDHMLEVDYEDGEWKTVEIKPYQPLLLSPSVAALHYGQAIFEGIKAYKNQQGEAIYFSAHSIISNGLIFLQKEWQCRKFLKKYLWKACVNWLDLDKNWIPAQDDHSLYIRPFMFSSDDVIGVRPSDKYKFMIILSPTGPYYSAPMRIYVEEKYVRAVPGVLDMQKLPEIMELQCMQPPKLKK